MFMQAKTPRRLPELLPHWPLSKAMPQAQWRQPPELPLSLPQVQV